jgi:hypothetical protein
MVRLLKILMMFVLCLNSLNMIAQQKEKKINLLHLSIEDQFFSIILDSVILHEKKCSYYDYKLLFSINTQKIDEQFLISIESQLDINLLLPLSAYGYFYHQNHLFIVHGDYCEDLFSTCGEKKAFKYLDYNPADFQKTGILYIFNDDSFSQWQYWYINNEFVLEYEPE